MHWALRPAAPFAAIVRVVVALALTAGFDDRSSVLPSVDEYLGALPHGIGAYPEAAVKGSVLLSLGKHAVFQELASHPGLPSEAARLVTDPPTKTTWVPEVVFNTLMCGFYDLTYRSRGGLEAYEAWVAAQNLRLFNDQIYRILFRVAGPERLLASVAARWGAFRRGSTLTIVKSAARSAELRLVFPRNLEPITALHSFSGAFRAALQAAGAKQQAAFLTPELGVSARWRLQWG
jgi:hypothetical protein